MIVLLIFFNLLVNIAVHYIALLNFKLWLWEVYTACKYIWKMCLWESLLSKDSRKNLTIVLYNCIASKHKAPSSAANVASGTKASKRSVNILLAPMAHKTGLSHFCLHVWPGACCRFQVSCTSVIKANAICWHVHATHTIWNYMFFCEHGLERWCGIRYPTKLTETRRQIRGRYSTMNNTRSLTLSSKTGTLSIPFLPTACQK